MGYKETAKIMLDRGLLKKQRIDFKQIEALLFRAQKDLSAARANLEIDEEVTYNYAYLAMLRCGRAIIFMKEYRDPLMVNNIKRLLNFLEEFSGKDLKILLINLIVCDGRGINLLMILCYQFQNWKLRVL